MTPVDMLIALWSYVTSLWLLVRQNPSRAFAFKYYKATSTPTATEEHVDGKLEFELTDFTHGVPHWLEMTTLKGVGRLTVPGQGRHFFGGPGPDPTRAGYKCQRVKRKMQKTRKIPAVLKVKMPSQSLLGLKMATASDSIEPPTASPAPEPSVHESSVPNQGIHTTHQSSPRCFHAARHNVASPSPSSQQSIESSKKGSKSG
ncbi:hypothetical protein BKA70DRAFT_1540566 [Coprinopsis sp. MPI-PUGE-AT-0042]|nr:hypothetical protein BKA70DRAFT_1540566 [Coprinopsis sp. MPI-PUGE-AT-0042]